MHFGMESAMPRRVLKKYIAPEISEVCNGLLEGYAWGSPEHCARDSGKVVSEVHPKMSSHSRGQQLIS